MPTGTQGTTARELPFQAIHYIRKDFTYLNDGQTIVVGTIPAGAVIIKPMSGVSVTTAFNGGSTNTLDIGYSDDSGTNNLATLLALGTLAYVPLDEVIGDFYTGASDRIISAKVVSTATASAGVGQIIIAYVPNNP